MDLDEVWRMREEDVYPTLFGPIARGIFPLTPALFDKLGQTDIDPRWLSHGVFEFASTDERPHWLYVTSGYSNPWETNPDDYDPVAESGAGVEFVFAVSEPGDWAIRTLQQVLAFDILAGAGRFPGADCLALHDRIPLRAPLNGVPDCALRALVVVPREDGPAEFTLPSGIVLLVGLTGITESEQAFAKVHGSAALIARLRSAGFHPVTDPGRRALGDIEIETLSEP